ncbi:MAG TPA: HD domain-containing protein [Thermoplasmata archaeon]|nr:HD domain-containing protein [Thermoplasmata archaeon]
MARQRASSGPRKSIFDPVHGTVVLEGAALALVGTPEFQRLWAIRQTGFAHLVFPGANHTRLEHSLGAYWVATRMAERLGLSEQEQGVVASAALLHDLGHGPFSHTFDGPMVEALGHGHEALSRARILGRDPAAPGEVPRVLERFGIDPEEVADLVDPPRRGGARPLLRGLLHGAVDADRIDYLQRDAHYTGVGHGAIDAVRLLETLRESKGRLVFAEKGRSAVEGFLVGRALMYSTVYYHKTVRAAEMMAQGALERMPGYPESARPTFRWTDGEWMTRLHAVGGLSQSLVDGLAERRLFKRVHGRPTVERAPRAAWHRLLVHPIERRALEDELATRARARPGSVLIDLAGLEPRGDPGRDWAEIGLVGERRTTFPFRQPSLWLLLATRPPSDWAVSVYAAPAHAAAVGRVLERDPSLLP